MCRGVYTWLTNLGLLIIGVKGAWDHDPPHNVPPHEPVPASVGGYGRFNYPAPPPPAPGQYPPNPYMMHHHGHPGPGEFLVTRILILVVSWVCSI